MTVSFIGVGAIGLPMSSHIQRAGHDVTGVDVSDSVIANAMSRYRDGMSLCHTPATKVVVVMIAAPDQLAGVVNLVDESVRGTVVVDHVNSWAAVPAGSERSSPARRLRAWLTRQ